MANAHESIFLPFSFKDIILFPEGLFSDLFERPCGCTVQISPTNLLVQEDGQLPQQSNLEVQLLLDPFEPR